MPVSWTYQFPPGETTFSTFRPALNPPSGGGLYLLSATGGNTSPSWLVGSYTDLKSIATNLRTSATHQKFAADNQLLFGFRDTDVAPTGQRQPDFGNPVAGPKAAQSFVGARPMPQLRPVQAGPAPQNRVTDQWENVRTYWAQRTVEAHHVVEFNNLETIGRSQHRGAALLDRNQLPCVLFMAEFHQRYISSVLKPTHGWDAARLRAGIADVYRNVYTQRNVGPAGCLRLDALWDVSRVILRTAGVAV